MVELRMRQREMRGDGGNHHAKLGLERIWCASAFTIPDMGGTCPDPACNNTNTRSSQPTEAGDTPDVSYPLESCTSTTSSSPVSLCLVHNSTIIAKHKVRSSLSLAACHDHEPTPSTASTNDSLGSLGSHDEELTPECSFDFRRASLQDRLPSASSLCELNGTVTVSHSHGCKSTNWWRESHHPAHRPLTTSKFSFNVAQSRPPRASSKSSNHGLQLHLWTHSIRACKFERSWLPSAFRNLLYSGLQVRMIMASMCISKHAWSRLLSATPNSRDRSLKVYLSTPLIMDSKFPQWWPPKTISKLCPSRPQSVSLSWLDHCFQEHLELLSITACC